MYRRLRESIAVAKQDVEHAGVPVSHQVGCRSSSSTAPAELSAQLWVHVGAGMHRTALACVSARKESQDQSQKAVRSSAEALVQLRQQQQLYDQLPAWLDKLLVHCGPLLVSPKHLSLDHKGL